MIDTIFYFVAILHFTLLPSGKEIWSRYLRICRGSVRTEVRHLVTFFCFASNQMALFFETPYILFLGIIILGNQETKAISKI